MEDAFLSVDSIAASAISDSHPTVELTRRRDFNQALPDQSSYKNAPAARVQRFVRRGVE